MDAIVTTPEREQIERVIDLPMRKKLQLAYELFRDNRVTPMMEAPLVAVVAYVLLPFNLIPRKLFFLRPFDDLIVGALGLWLFVKLTPPELLAEHLDQVEGSREE